jgi:hypothetical protein
LGDRHHVTPRFSSCCVSQSVTMENIDTFLSDAVSELARSMLILHQM